MSKFLWYDAKLLIGEKLLLVICIKKQRDFIPKHEENDNNNTAWHFLDSRVSLKLSTQIADYSFKLTIVLEAGCKQYIRKAHPSNSISLWGSNKYQKRCTRQIHGQHKDSKIRFKDQAINKEYYQVNCGATYKPEATKDVQDKPKSNKRTKRDVVKIK